ncbi:MAG: FAD-binding oxidoreductase [Actinomycetota bacterium]|nr:FAD-binding oxidoreductase [Actinomycetota bacterium]
MTKDYRSYSLWLDSLGEDLEPRPALGGDVDVDVAIVGAGYTGLWTAYYLAKADPTMRIAVVEKEIAGFGASGRNGGWCSALFAAKPKKIAKKSGREGAVAMQRAMFATIDEVGRVAHAEKIDAHFRKGGTLVAATTPAQLQRVRESVEEERAWGFTEDDFRWLEEDEARAVIDVAGCLGGAYTPHCARVQPARLARGLARAVEKLGVVIYEQTEATALRPRAVVTNHGTVRADVVVRAIEGYTPNLRNARRVLLPLYSLMIATEPLPEAFWDDIGWRRGETFADGRHLIIYAQRTADDRIAIGGRGAPYHFGSRIKESFDREPEVFAELQRVLRTLWPALGDARITHEWGGPLGAPRDWYSSVGFDRASGSAWAGGYVGDGVSTTNLAGRTLRDLILERDTDIVRLPWVHHRSRRWEPEPFRWIGTNVALKMMASADHAEARTGKPARRADLVGKLIGI